MLVEKLSNAIKHGHCLLKKDAVIALVCGKNTSSPNSNRKLFIDYARKYFDGFHFLLAEDFFKIDQRNQIDLLTIEKNLTNYSDCIIIILESESAYTELGAFSLDDELSKKILPINNVEFKEAQSFINLGPLNKIDRLKKGLGPTVHTKMDSFLECMHEVQLRLNKIVSKQRKAIRFKSISDFQLLHKERLLLTHDIIKLLSPISMHELVDIFRKALGENSFREIHTDTQLLEALGFIAKKSNFLLSTKQGLRFIDFPGDNRFLFRSMSISYYKKHSPHRLALLALE